MRDSPNSTHPTLWTLSSLATALFPRCLSPSLSRRWFTWVHKFWRKGRSTCGLATFGVSVACSCTCKDPTTFKSFLRSTAFCWVGSLSESPLSGTSEFRSRVILKSLYTASLVRWFFTGKGSLADGLSDDWRAALCNPSIEWSPLKSEFFPKIQPSLSPRGKLFWWGEKQHH